MQAQKTNLPRRGWMPSTTLLFQFSDSIYSCLLFCAGKVIQPVYALSKPLREWMPSNLPPFMQTELSLDASSFLSNLGNNTPLQKILIQLLRLQVASFILPSTLLYVAAGIAAYLELPWFLLGYIGWLTTQIQWAQSLTNLYLALAMPVEFQRLACEKPPETYLALQTNIPAMSVLREYRQIYEIVNTHQSDSLVITLNNTDDNSLFLKALQQLIPTPELCDELPSVKIVVANPMQSFHCDTQTFLTAIQKAELLHANQPITERPYTLRIIPQATDLSDSDSRPTRSNSPASTTATPTSEPEALDLASVISPTLQLSLEEMDVCHRGDTSEGEVIETITWGKETYKAVNRFLKKHTATDTDTVLTLTPSEDAVQEAPIELTASQRDALIAQFNQDCLADIVTPVYDALSALITSLAAPNPVPSWDFLIAGRVSCPELCATAAAQLTYSLAHHPAETETEKPIIVVGADCQLRITPSQFQQLSQTIKANMPTRDLPGIRPTLFVEQDSAHLRELLPHLLDILLLHRQTKKNVVLTIDGSNKAFSWFFKLLSDIADKPQAREPQVIFYNPVSRDILMSISLRLMNQIFAGAVQADELTCSANTGEFGVPQYGKTTFEKRKAIWAACQWSECEESAEPSDTSTLTFMDAIPLTTLEAQVAAHFRSNMPISSPAELTTETQQGQVEAANIIENHNTAVDPATQLPCGDLKSRKLTYTLADLATYFLLPMAAATLAKIGYFIFENGADLSELSKHLLFDPMPDLTPHTSLISLCLSTVRYFNQAAGVYVYPLAMNSDKANCPRHVYHLIATSVHRLTTMALMYYLFDLMKAFLPSQANAPLSSIAAGIETVFFALMLSYAFSSVKAQAFTETTCALTARKMLNPLLLGFEGFCLVIDATKYILSLIKFQEIIDTLKAWKRHYFPAKPNPMISEGRLLLKHILRFVTKYGILNFFVIPALQGICNLLKLPGLIALTQSTTHMLQNTTITIERVVCSPLYQGARSTLKHGSEMSQNLTKQALGMLIWLVGLNKYYGPILWLIKNTSLQDFLSGVCPGVAQLDLTTLSEEAGQRATDDIALLSSIPTKQA